MDGEGYRMTATRYRIYPNATAEKAMRATLESCRLLYNRLLEDCRNAAINILERGLGVETFREAENGRRRRQHGCRACALLIDNTHWSNITFKKIFESRSVYESCYDMT